MDDQTEKLRAALEVLAHELPNILGPLSYWLAEGQPAQAHELLPQALTRLWALRKGVGEALAEPLPTYSLRPGRPLHSEAAPVDDATRPSMSVLGPEEIDAVLAVKCPIDNAPCGRCEHGCEMGIA